MAREKSSGKQTGKRYYNYQFKCPTFDATGESKYFPTPIDKKRCPVCRKIKGKNSAKRCDFSIVET